MRNWNRKNNHTELLHELSDVGDSERGFVRFATAYGTPDGIVVEIYGSKVSKHIYPLNGHRELSTREKLESLVTEPVYEQDGLPHTIKTWGNFVSVKRVKVTPATYLDGKSRRTWREDVEGSYRDDPFEGSHIHEHSVSSLNMEE